MNNPIKIDVSDGGSVTIELTIKITKDKTKDPASDPAPADPEAKKRGRPRKNFILELDAFRDETKWRRKISEATGLTEAGIDDALTAFISFCELTGKDHTKPHEAKAHFYNWYRKREIYAAGTKSATELMTALDDDRRAREYAEKLQSGGH